VKYSVEIGASAFEIEVTVGQLLVNGRVQDVQLSGRPGDPARRLVRGRASRPFIVSEGDGRGEWQLTSGGARLHVLVLDPRETAIRQAGARRGAGAGSEFIKAPMPGLVLRVLVAAGAEVVPGQGLVVIEAMKMENELKAAGSGVVREVRVAVGDKVERGTVLIAFQ